MISVALGNNRHCFFLADSISSCYLLLAEKTKDASCKCLFDTSFLNNVAFPTPLIEEVVSHPVRACRKRSLVQILDPKFFYDIMLYL